MAALKVLGICGSPHTNGLCAKLLKEALAGSEEAGAKTDLIFLGEKEIKPCIDCMISSCWEEMKCNLDDSGIELRKKINESDAIILTAPVYFLSVNGLTKNFMDRMRYYGKNGKPALPIALAGGTGKGCIITLQEICRWLLMLGFRPINPLPVTRYDIDIALTEVKKRGMSLIKEECRPFSNLAEKIAWYESLPYMRWGIVEEISYIAKLSIDRIGRSGRPELATDLQKKLERGNALMRAGRYAEGVKLVIEAHEESMHIFDRL
jgi:NAD(P)H-dependent FMN reductase